MNPRTSLWRRALSELGGFLLPTGDELDFLRRLLARGLQVGASEQEARRGEEVEAFVTVPRARRVGEVEVGLVCTECYGEESTYSDSSGTHTSSRSTVEEIAHEAWRSVESAQGEQRVHFTIPPEAPFSYEGDCLSFNWEVVARERRKHGLDRLVRREISVPP
jgi:hypothetical protein